MTRPAKRLIGFTLIELMLVVAIINLLAAIAIPKFAGLIVKSKEAAVKGKLGSLRSAMAIYYADNDGELPFLVLMGPTDCVLVPKYLNAIPSISIPTVPYHDNCSSIADHSPSMDADFSSQSMGRAWEWDGIAFMVNCSHADTKNVVWSTY